LSEEGADDPTDLQKPSKKVFDIRMLMFDSLSWYICSLSHTLLFSFKEEKKTKCVKEEHVYPILKEK